MKHSLIKFIMFFFLVVSSISAGIIKIGTIIDIKVNGHQEFSGSYKVSSSGTIDYPFLADETIVDISTSELMNDLTFRLARHVDNPLVLITIVDQPPITITVLGQVKMPGPVQAYTGVSLQEVIQLAGGALETANLANVKIVHKNGNNANATLINLKKFLKTGDMHMLPNLLADDIVILLSQTSTKKIKVIGAVNKPGFYDLEERLNIFELIYLAGGPAEKANLSRVRRFYRTGDKTMEEIVNLQSFIDKGDMDKIPFAQEGDVIIVYSRWFDWKIFMNILSNVLLFIVTIRSIQDAVN